MSEADRAVQVGDPADMMSQTELVDRHRVDRSTVRRLIATEEIRCELADSTRGSGKRKLYSNIEFLAALERYRNGKNKRRDIKEEINHQRARNLQIKNDQLEAKLIPRSEAVEAIRLMAGAVNGVRIRAEQEYPRLFAEAGDAIPANKLVLIQLFDDLFSQFREIGKTMETNK